MRKQTKWAVILGAAAVMTFGACMTSFAATGWVLDGGTWYYYDKDEEAVTEKWIKHDNGKWYYLGEDGDMLTNSWVDDGNTYYVDASGARVISGWKYVYAMDDDDAEEKNWFWFDANGKMVTGKKLTINNQVYYFDEDGKMLTGWINTQGNPAKATAFVQDETVYAVKSGERATGWAKLLPSDIDEDNAEDDDKEWYYFTSTGAARYNKKVTINSKSYVFDDDGIMISGWAVNTGTTSAPNYEEVTASTSISDFGMLSYTGKKDDGAVKTSSWIYSAGPGMDDAEADSDDFDWYYAGSNGTLATSVNNISANAQVKGDKIAIGGNSTIATAGDADDLGLLKINAKTYGFGTDGKMVSGLWRFVQVPGATNYTVATYYFGKSNDGAMKTGAMTLKNEDTEESYGYHFSATTTTIGRGSTGVQSNKLYDQGLLVTANQDSKYGAAIVNGQAYIINESGKAMSLTSTSVYTDDNGAKYKMIGKQVYYTTDGKTTPSVDSTGAPVVGTTRIVTGPLSTVLHYDNT